MTGIFTVGKYTVFKKTFHTINVTFLLLLIITNNN